MRPEAQGSIKSLFNPVDFVFFMLERLCSVWAAWSLAEVRGVGDLELAAMWGLGIRPRSSKSKSGHPLRRHFPSPSGLYALLTVALHCCPRANCEVAVGGWRGDS